ncbi:MAG: propanediol utilization protein [Rhodovulum sulfidophilum]|uniref:Propanediol utilization protein n=1 Tax=Rhodovulum sulfidophilum TaxID=35806 RepID=A0A2W5MZB9_RHOSU|nr:MAG: propanediol utilization protein [Rhodovulum sulfidophilum]
MQKPRVFASAGNGWAACPTGARHALCAGGRQGSGRGLGLADQHREIAGEIRVAGHFGELLQGRIGEAGPVALVTLPCPARGLSCAWRPGGFALHGLGPRALTPAAARALLRHARLPPRGAFRLRGDLPPGCGAGASTAARVALLRAAARAAGLPPPPPETLAALCLASEGATDPLMFPEPARLLWGSRAGRGLATLPAPPAFAVLGGFLGAPRRTDPADTAFPDIADLARAWPAACADPAAAARLASESARRTLALRHAGEADPTEALARRLGALGFAIAHTGSARALLFAPGTAPPGAKAALRAAGLTGITAFATGRA